MSLKKIQRGELVFDRFKLIRELGTGAMGQVHLAHDVRGHRDVALKRMHRVSPNMVQRFRREYRALAAIRHKGVPAIFDIGESNGEPFFTMEIVGGETLEAHLQRHGPIEPVRALTLAIELGRVLMAVHAVGVVHRDVKPSNVIIEPGDRVRLLDFGICCLTSDYYRQPHLRALTSEVERWHTTEVWTLGNDYYVDPQLTTVGTSPQNDVFSVCVVLYELLLGRPLYDSDMRRFGEIQPAEFSAALAPLVAVLQRGVAEPLERHRTMAELVKALEVVRGCLAESARPPALAPASSWRAPALCLALGLLGGVPVGVGVASSTTGTPEAPTTATRSTTPGPSPIEASPVETPPVPTSPAAAPIEAASNSAAPVPESTSSPPGPEPPERHARQSPVESWDARMRKAEAHARRCLAKKNVTPRPLDVTIAADKPPSVWGAGPESTEARCIRGALRRHKLTVDEGQRQHTFFEES